MIATAMIKRKDNRLDIIGQEIRWHRQKRVIVFGNILRNLVDSVYHRYRDSPLAIGFARTCRALPADHSDGLGTGYACPHCHAMSMATPLTANSATTAVIA
jgi:hypothetical protein